jgi:hypothetical protein
MTERETIRQLARQESARRNESAQQQEGSIGMTNEEYGQLAEQLRQIQGRLDHIEKNLIIQQPSVFEITKQLYPHMEAVFEKCETAGQRLLALEKMLDEHETHMAENWKATDQIVERQKTEFTAISERFQGLAIKDLQGCLQQMRADLATALAAEEKCEETLAQCRELARQVLQIYETASGNIQELAVTAASYVNQVRESSEEAIEQARVKFVRTFRRLDTTIWESPLLSLALAGILVVMLSAITGWALNTFTGEREIRQAIKISATATQEAVTPVIEKIQRQTQNLDVIYEQSEAFELYLRSLPANQRDKKRAELIKGAKSQKQKAPEDARKQAD